MATQQTTRTIAVPSGALHPIAPARLNKPVGRPDMVPVGTWVWLASELMFFAALFAAFFMIRENTGQLADAAGTTSLWASEKKHLAVTFAAINTAILVFSSITCQFGVHQAEHGRVKRVGGPFNVAKWGLREWYILTFILGAIFIAGQAMEYTTLASEGLNPSTNVFWSLFFLATGFHGLHVIGGLLAFLFTLGRTYLARTFTHEQAVTAMVVSYYWHFVDVVWIILFAAVYILP